MYCENVTNDKTKIRRSLFVWGFVLITLIATTAAGANAPAGGSVQIIDKFEVEEDFGIRKALAMLGSLCDKNIVPSPSVDGVLAFRSLKNVTFEEAMDAILGENFKYEQEGKLIKVYTKDEYKKIKEDPARKVYKVFTLYYITAQEAQKLLIPVLSADAMVQVSSPAEKSISSGISGGSSAGGGIAGGASQAGSGGGDSLALHDTIVVYDFPENIEKAGELIKTLDIRPKQVLVEATVLSALLTEGMELGVDWNFMAGVALDGTSATQDYVTGDTVSRGDEATSPIAQISDIVDGTPLEAAGFATQGGRGLRVGVRTGDFRMFITALESVTDTTVLANPKILTVNKQEGSVLIGTKLGYRSSTTISTGGVATEGEVEFLQTGTQLIFRPYIGNDGYVRMEIYPKDSSATLNEDGVPTENTTELKTNIVVKDGETIVKDELQSIGRTRLAEDHYAKAAKSYIEGDNESAMKELKVALTLRPSYLEAIRLKEKIMAEVSPAEVEKMERILLETVESKDTTKWNRR